VVKRNPSMVQIYSGRSHPSQGVTALWIDASPALEDLFDSEPLELTLGAGIPRKLFPEERIRRGQLLRREVDVEDTRS